MGILSDVGEVYEKSTGVPAIVSHEPFRVSAWTSDAEIDFNMALEEKFNLFISLISFAELKTFNDIISYLADHGKN